MEIPRNPFSRVFKLEEGLYRFSFGKMDTFGSTAGDYVVLCATRLTRSLVLHLPAVACAVALALGIAGSAAGLQVVPGVSSGHAAQGAALGLLAVAFFAQGLLLAWRLIAAEAPLTGESFAAQLRRVARADAWLCLLYTSPSPRDS